MNIQFLMYLLAAISFFIAAIKALIKFGDPAQPSPTLSLIDFVALGLMFFVIAFALVS